MSAANAGEQITMNDYVEIDNKVSAPYSSPEDKSGKLQQFRRKYTKMVEPPVSTMPFVIDLDEDKCTGCGICVQQCPAQVLELVDRAPSDKQQPPCQNSCPAGVDIRTYLTDLASGGSQSDAWKVITDTNPIPGVTGRVCDHRCEQGCNRQYQDETVNIHGMERVIGDHAIENQLVFKKPAVQRAEKIVVIGSGPSGLSAAYQLARRGYKVTIFESSDHAGGMLRYALPRYRLPVNVVESEIARIEALGVEIRCNVRIGRDITLQELKQQYKAVYVGVGAQTAIPMDIANREAKGVVLGLNFLRDFAEHKADHLSCKKVVIVGAGDTAMDCARTALRLGASKATVLYRRSEAEIPATEEEYREALEEGVEFEFLCSPLSVKADSTQQMVALDCIRMQLGEPDPEGRASPSMVPGSEFEFAADMMILALGQQVSEVGVSELMRGKWIDQDGSGATLQQGVFAGGDAACGLGSIADALGSGRKAAEAIDAWINGVEPPQDARRAFNYSGAQLRFDRHNEPKNTGQAADVGERIACTELEVHDVLNDAQALLEANRCLGCGTSKSELTGQDYFGKVCVACRSCEAACPEDALKFNNYYRVEEGLYKTELITPNKDEGWPNPLRQAQPVDFESIKDQLTETERVIYTRRSNRVFTPEQVSDDLIHRVLETGRFAPSAGNAQPWQFLVIQDRELLDEISDETRKPLTRFTKLWQSRNPLVGLLKRYLVWKTPHHGDQRPFGPIQGLSTPKFGPEGPMDMFVGAKTVIFCIGNKVGIGEMELNVGLAAQNMVLAAHSLGLGTCYVSFAAEGLEYRPKLKEKLGLQWPHDKVITTIAIGHPSIPIDGVVEREMPKVFWKR
jgi:NADPH-dependent glutamate synthase beta subunit-like oxidoreductase/nitroreductase/NAD-dependent dihydropyrimidine dehydrogenase PreA subunit